MKSKWRLSDMPDLEGRIAVVTGGNIGLGFKSALELARKGAQVVIGCRTVSKGEAAEERIRSEVPEAQLETLQLDLVDSASIEAFALAFSARHGQLHILMNNAGVVNLEALERTPEGHEMHMATNHYGHFALTGRLYQTLISTDQARVVTLSSAGHRLGEIRFDDLDWRKRAYVRDKAYGDSKLANLMFTVRLQQKFAEESVAAISVAAHPGLTGTERQQSIGVGGALARKLASSVDMGCLSQLMAATSSDVRGGQFIGPRFTLRGYPADVTRKLAELDQKVIDRLWRVTEEITGVTYS